MAIFRIKSVSAGKCLNIYGDNVTSLAYNQNVCLWADSGTNEQKWSITSLGSGVYVRSVINTAFGLNVYRSGSPWNCDVYPVSGNETDAKINFVKSGNYYKIQLANYTSYYLTAGGTANGSNVYWTTATGGNNQLWNVIDENIPTTGTGYTYPTTIRKMTQAYSSGHPAIDIGAAEGTPIYAFADGTVAFRQNSSGSWHPDATNPPYGSGSMQTMGNCIAINHTNPTSGSGLYARTIYMHMRDNPTLAPGTTVKKGQIIGYIGNTGRSSGAHLHFALSIGNLSSMAPGATGWVSLSNLPAVNPKTYLPEYYI